MNAAFPLKAGGNVMQAVELRARPLDRGEREPPAGRGGAPSLPGPAPLSRVGSLQISQPRQQQERAHGRAHCTAAMLGSSAAVLGCSAATLGSSAAVLRSSAAGSSRVCGPGPGRFWGSLRRQSSLPPGRSSGHDERAPAFPNPGEGRRRKRNLGLE